VWTEKASMIKKHMLKDSSTLKLIVIVINEIRILDQSETSDKRWIVNFDLDQLRAFDAVMRLKSFRAAADNLDMPQSSLSHQIGRLEAQLDRKLFSRTTRRVEATPDGRALHAYACSMLGIADEARRHFERAPVDGILKLGIVEDYALGELHLVLGLFRRQFPRFFLSLKSGLSARLFRELDAGELEVVLGKRLKGRSQGRLVYERPLVWCGDPAIVPSGDEFPIPVVTYTHPSSTRTLIESALKRAGRPYTIVAESEGLAGIQAAVVAGFGITAFSDGFRPPPVPQIAEQAGLPALDSVEYVIDQRPRPHSQALDAFVSLLSASATALSKVPS
jgi:DNA-binding transcriptional LysR family regulator